MSKLHIKKGDTVKVLSGADNGKTGKIINVDREKGRAFVEGVNLVSKHTKPSAANPQGGIVKREASVHISNLMVVDSKGQASRIGRKLNKDGKLVRYSKKHKQVDLIANRLAGMAIESVAFNIGRVVMNLNKSQQFELLTALGFEGDEELMNQLTLVPTKKALAA